MDESTLILALIERIAETWVGTGAGVNSVFEMSADRVPECRLNPLQLFSSSPSSITMRERPPKQGHPLTECGQEAGVGTPYLSIQPARREKYDQRRKACLNDTGDNVVRSTATMDIGTKCQLSFM